MSLKNWTTTFKSLKKHKGGFLGYVKYLQNDNHRNHNSTDHKILNLGFNHLDTYVENKKILDKFNYEKIKNNVGGRPSTNMGVSVVISFPFEENDDNKLKKYVNSLLKQYYVDLIEMNNLKANSQSFAKWKKLVFANVHKKNTGSKTQINLTLPHYLPNVETKIVKKKGLILDKNVEVQQINFKKIDMSQKKYSFLMKELNNKLAFKILGKDYRTYEIQSKEAQIKRKKQNVYKSEDLNEKAHILDLRENQLNDLEDELKVGIRKLQIKVKKFDEMSLDDKTIRKYINRANNHLKNNEMDKFKDNVRKIEQRVEKVANHNKIEFDDM